MKLSIDRPADNMLTDLAPRVQILSHPEYRYAWGYALALTSEDAVRILVDDDGMVIDVDHDKVLFHKL